MGLMNSAPLAFMLKLDLEAEFDQVTSILVIGIGQPGASYPVSQLMLVHLRA